MSELLNCPFCGGRASAIRHLNFYSVLCLKCGSQIRGKKTKGGLNAKDIAFKAWNTRAAYTTLIDRAIAYFDSDNWKLSSGTETVVQALERIKREAGEGIKESLITGI